MLGVPEGCPVEGWAWKKGCLPVWQGWSSIQAILETQLSQVPWVNASLQPHTWHLHGQPHPICNGTWHASMLTVLFSPKYLSCSQSNSLVLSLCLSLMLLPPLSACRAMTPHLPVISVLGLILSFMFAWFIPKTCEASRRSKIVSVLSLFFFPSLASTVLYVKI